MALVQVAGVASIFPFMHLVMEPDIIENSSSLNIIYNFFEFSTHRSFIIFLGFLCF